MPERYFGKYKGTVKDNRDDDNLGRLQVSVPAIFPEKELVTALPALPYGFFFVPENEATVWIEFVGGDTGEPIWTGILLVPGQWPGEAKVTPPQKRVIKTASGHFIIFDDKSGEESIQIKENKDGHIITLDNNGITVTDGKNQHSITLDNGGISVKDGKNQHSITLDSTGVTVESKAGTGATIKLAAQGVTLDGGASPVTISGSTVSIKGSSILLGEGAQFPVLRTTQALGNMGAPVAPIIPSTVLAS